MRIEDLVPGEVYAALDSYGGLYMFRSKGKTSFSFRTTVIATNTNDSFVGISIGSTLRIPEPWELCWFLECESKKQPLPIKRFKEQYLSLQIY